MSQLINYFVAIYEKAGLRSLRIVQCDLYVIICRVRMGNLQAGVTNCEIVKTFAATLTVEKSFEINLRNGFRRSAVGVRPIAKRALEIFTRDAFY